MALPTSDPETDLLTKAEAAMLLKVSPVTISRWLKQGRLPAYRLGPRAIRIRRADLDRLLLPVTEKERRQKQTPTTRESDSDSDRHRWRIYHDVAEALTLLTDEEIERGRAAMDAARELREEMLGERGGKPFPPSWPLIREARDER